MPISYNNNFLHFDNINLKQFSEESLTPYYLYSESLITDNFNTYVDSLREFNHLICYSVKANSNLSILSILAKQGSGFDIVSGGELQKVIAAGGDTKKVVFSGVGKTEEEINYALENEILCFNIESNDELITINNLANKKGVTANVSFRVNPEINVDTHPYIATGMKDNKFGIDEKTVISLYDDASKLDSLKITGIDFHIGSQINSTSPFIDSIKKINNIVTVLADRNIHLEHIDIGGGLGISYESNANLLSIKNFINELSPLLSKTGLKVIVEPGRSIVGKSGILVSKVLNIKSTPDKIFVVIDAGMNDFIRPALYNADHNILPIVSYASQKFICDVVGPICETADFMGKDKELYVKTGDYIAIEDVGAYGFSLASNYNVRPRPDEYIINSDTKSIKKIREREDYNDMVKSELKFLKT